MQDRREFLIRTMTSVAVAGLPASKYGESTPLLKPGGRSQRRRLIYNNDGGDTYLPQSTTPEKFLEQRMKTLPGTHVDSIYYCGFGTLPCWETQYPLGPEQDPIRVAGGFARRNDMEFVFSMRMNDIHDSFLPGHLNKFKQTHPEFLLGNFDDRALFEHFLRWNRKQGDHPLRNLWETVGRPSATWFLWSALNYAALEVRKWFLSYIEQVCQRYDLGGIELDWCRHPFFFRPGEERKNIPLMTDFVRAVRQRIGEISREKGKAIQVAMRVADTPELSLNNGLDAASWIEEGLVDVLIAGAGYVPFTTPVHEWIGLAHAKGIPVYPCLSGSTPAFLNIEAARAAAQRFWAEGADGIYWFNLFVMAGTRGGALHDQSGRARPVVKGAQEVHDPHQQQIIEETGDPHQLSHLNKLYTVDRTESGGYIAHICPPVPLPVSFSTWAGSAKKTISIPVEDNLEEASREGSLSRFTLKCLFQELAPEDQIQITLNRLKLPGDAASSSGDPTGGQWLEWKLQPGQLRSGVNDVTVTLHKRSPSNSTSLTLDEVHLGIRYKS